jgi:solute carrier family 25 protein 34/35
MSATVPLSHGIIYTGAAASFAAAITHPADTIKTRMQLTAAARYQGMLHCVRHTLRLEGLRGLQRGVALAVIREPALNCVRIGLFEPSLALLHNRAEGPPSFPTSFAAGLLTGACGALITNPLDLLKTRLQAQAVGVDADISFQHRSMGVHDALRRLLKAEGLRGCFRGIGASITRMSLGSAAQLSAYTHLKERALARQLPGPLRGWSVRDGPLLHIALSFASVVLSVTAMQPADVVRTHLYNQPFDARGLGTLYTGSLDCAAKLCRFEGVQSLFKGWTAHYCRSAPHIALMFFALEQLKQRRPLG